MTVALRRLPRVAGSLLYSTNHYASCLALLVTVTTLLRTCPVCPTVATTSVTYSLLAIHVMSYVEIMSYMFDIVNGSMSITNTKGKAKNRNHRKHARIKRIWHTDRSKYCKYCKPTYIHSRFIQDTYSAFVTTTIRDRINKSE